jgi:hypothetical protein
MTMRKSLVALLLTAVACFSAIDVASAEAVEYVHHVGVKGGGNYFGPFVKLFAAEVVGYGQGLGCAGIRGVSGVVCESSPGEYVAIILGSDINSEPYIHNHSSFESFFNGYYYS